ncbi:serine hydrolase [Nocardioides sp. Arc9.136]|uniref:serine hydrolase n=1 Tax=Nocardioides sp. Arc9.136 TaxID=2996826 RepID=UPI002666D828|nr:serine hydrolase [Nocardioides sp. Arc9.136]WKN50251.1 serine hydrolase [Nocardioides sp. Arc9.136]
MAAPRPDRRALLLGLAAAPLAACGSDGPARVGRPPTRSPVPTATPAPRPAVAALGRIEERYDAVVGVAAAGTGGLLLGHRAGSRFALCSTFKPLLAAALLDRDGPPDARTRRLMADAVRDSDNDAANALLAYLGGPAALTAYLRGTGDGVTRLDRTEPALNEHAPGDPRDTSTPAALATTYSALLLGDALPTGRRLLTDLLVASTTGEARIRAAVPDGWRVGDKTGTGGHGSVNDVAVLWPPGRDPWVLAVLVRSRRADGEVPEAAVADAAAVAIRAVGRLSDA